jgi:deoxyadenosine/deoxycytidine kinase
MMYITIEGIIGAGKTTLAKSLANKTGSKLVLEEFAENPFLSRFYENPSEMAFQLEMSFLRSRKAQLDRELHPESALVISDYHFQKTMIFASQTLYGTDFEHFEQSYRLESAGLPDPDLIIFVDTQPAAASENIRKRGRTYEQNIALPYLEKLYEKYHQWLSTFEPGKVIIVPQQHGLLTEDNELIKRILRT